METIDNTGKSRAWDYGTILQCWKDNLYQYGQYDLFRIAKCQNSYNKYELDILHHHTDDEQACWGSTYSNMRELKEELDEHYDHVAPVKAIITIEDL